MKKASILFYLGIWISLAGSNMTAQVPYQLNGSWESGSGKTLVLKLLHADDPTGVRIDSAVVAPDGSFSMKGTVKEIGYGMLNETDGKSYGYRIVFFDGTPVSLLLNDTIVMIGKQQKDGITYRMTKGNKEQEAAQEILRYFSNHFIRSFNAAFTAATLEKESLTQHETDSLKTAITQIEATDKKEINDFFQAYGHCLVAPFFMEMNMLKEFSGAELLGYFNRLSDNVKASAKGKEIGELIRKINLLAPGADAPDFSLTTPEGKRLSLKDFRGHIVLIDFWASWCAPCLGEMPNLKAIYEKFHPAGLEIIGVSMDNHQTAWTKAIEKEALPWHHVSSLKGMKACPVAKDYQVLAIPKLYIIGKEGKIIAKDLRGEALAEKIAEVIGGK